MDEIELYNSRESFEGAINGDPELNGENGIILFGKRSKYLYGDSIDFDFSSGFMDGIPVTECTNPSLTAGILTRYKAITTKLRQRCAQWQWVTPKVW